MTSEFDGHVRVLPLQVANQIAAGEVVERPASVVKELVENAIDAGANEIRIAIQQGGRKLIAVQDNGSGMTREDALLALERQATSKIRSVADIEHIATLGFRGEAIPSIASVSRFSITTRRADSDEGTFVQVNAGKVDEVRAAGCPVGTLVEVRELFCNVPARRKFLRAIVTEESHVKQVFTVHAIAHPDLGFTLVIDGREVYRLAPAGTLSDRLTELFGCDFLLNLAELRREPGARVEVSGYLEKPQQTLTSRHDQYIFVNGRPASSPSVAYAIKTAYPRKQGDFRPAAILFIKLDPSGVDVNVHPTKREVRFRDNAAVKTAIESAITRALTPQQLPPSPPQPLSPPQPQPQSQPLPQPLPTPQPPPSQPLPSPAPLELPLAPDCESVRPWQWFKFLAQSASGYLIVETDAGIITINPIAARERIAYEQLLAQKAGKTTSQTLLIPEIVKLSPVDFARLNNSLATIRELGFQLEEFGADTFKIEALPQLLGELPITNLLATIARDLAEGGNRRSGERWRAELIAKSVARSFAGAKVTLTEAGATKLIEELCACKMPYVCPRGKPVMIFTSTRELDRKFDRY